MVLFAGGQVVLNPVRVNELLRGPTGPVFRRMMVDAELVRQEAKRRVGVSKPDPVPRKRPKPPPGQLRDSLVKRPVIVGDRVTWLIGSDLPYALYHHEGTQPHEIVPLKAPALVFYWPRTGAIMFVQHVNHPGNRPNRFLTDSLSVLRGRY